MTTAPLNRANKINVSSRLFCSAQLFKKTKIAQKTMFIKAFNKIFLFIAKLYQRLYVLFELTKTEAKIFAPRNGQC